MNDLANVAPPFVAMAHSIVWATVATVDPVGRPRSRVLHPYWEWDGTTLTGIVATGPTELKRAHLAHSPYASVTYWAPNHDTCTAECGVEWDFSDEGRVRAWETFKEAPAPVGYDPAIIPAWSGGPTAPEFAVLRLAPWRLRVMPGTFMLGQGGELLVWRDRAEP